MHEKLTQTTMSMMLVNDGHQATMDGILSNYNCSQLQAQCKEMPLNRIANKENVHVGYDEFKQNTRDDA